MQARWYDPGSGRFLSTDPLIRSAATPQSANPYSYTENNPVNGVDPDGRKLIFFGGRASAILGGGGEAGAGVFFGTHEGPSSNQGFFGTSFDFGLFASVGGGGGFDVGVSLEVGAVDSLSGTAVNLNGSLDTPIGVGIGGSIIADPSAENLAGADNPTVGDFTDTLVIGTSASFGIGLPPGSASVTTTISRTTTDLGRSIINSIVSFFSDSPDSDSTRDDSKPNSGAEPVPVGGNVNPMTLIPPSNGGGMGVMMGSI